MPHFKVIQNKATTNDSFFLMVAHQITRNFGFTSIEGATVDGQAYGLFTDQHLSDVQVGDIIEITKAELDNFTPIN